MKPSHFLYERVFIYVTLKNNSIHIKKHLITYQFHCHKHTILFFYFTTEIQSCYISFFNNLPCLKYTPSVERFAKNTPIKMRHAPIPITGLIGSPKNTYPVITAIDGDTYSQVDGNTGLVFDKSQ